jgi:GPI mannosyltransferase 1 subunit M
LLALVLTPNEWLHPSFGKYLFAACDILNGFLIYKLLVSVVLPYVPANDKSSKEFETPSSVQNVTSSRSFTSLATLYTSLHLLNPLVFTISTRGSSESILTSLVLLTLYSALQDRWDLAAILLGVSTHWKVFPVIYGVGCLGVIGRHRKGDKGEGELIRRVRTLVNWRTVRFGAISAGTFVVMGVCCYLM